MLSDLCDYEMLYLREGRGLDVFGPEIVTLPEPWPPMSASLCLARFGPSRDELLGPAEKREGAGLGARYDSWLHGRLAAKAAWASWTASRGLKPTDPRQVETLRAESGAPRLFVGGAPAPGSLSISHGGALAGAVYSEERPLGLDLEALDRPLGPRVAQFAFRPEELRLVENSGAWPGLLAVWCAKEAAAKSWGLGLLNHLSTVKVDAADWGAGLLSAVLAEGEGIRFSAEVRLIRFEGRLLALARAGGVC